jgi:outer membrane protein assembly factor BamB
MPAADWPEWRGGPARDGTWNEPGLPSTLPPNGPKTLWKQTVGTGYSGPSVANGRLYIMDRLEVPAAPEDTERVLCLDADTGEILWTHAYPCALDLPGGYENGPRTTPTVRDGKVYALGAMGHLHCLDAVTGAVLWMSDLRQDYNARIPQWGAANSPLLEGDQLILQAGGSPDATLIAFDRNTGAKRWHSLTNMPGYASLLIIQPGESRQLIAWTADALCSVDPSNGTLLWQHPRELAWEQAVATPVYHAPSRTLLISSDREGSLALRLKPDRTGFEILWDNFSLSSLHSVPVLKGAHLYGLNHNGRFKNECGEFRCVDLLAGEKLWAERTVTRIGGFAQAIVTLNRANDVFYITNELGELILARADSEGYRELARAQLTGKTWTHPAYANGRIYARSEKTLLCADLNP